MKAHAYGQNSRLGQAHRPAFEAARPPCIFYSRAVGQLGQGRCAPPSFPARRVADNRRPGASSGCEFDRSSRGVVPTIYGRALLARGRAAFEELKQGIRDIEFLSDPTAGELKIGCPEAIAAILPP